MSRPGLRIVGCAALCALLVLTASVRESRATEAGLELAPVAISRVRLEFSCGPTPTPGAPPPNCPPQGWVEFVFRGKRCDAADFELRVRKRKWSQVVLVYRRTSSDCRIDRSSWDGGDFTRIELTTGKIDPYRTILLKNPVPILYEPRP